MYSTSSTVVLPCKSCPCWKVREKHVEMALVFHYRRSSPPDLGYRGECPTCRPLLVKSLSLSNPPGAIASSLWGGIALRGDAASVKTACQCLLHTLLNKCTVQQSIFYIHLKLKYGEGSSSSRSSHPPHEKRPFAGERLWRMLFYMRNIKGPGMCRVWRALLHTWWQEMFPAPCVTMLLMLHRRLPVDVSWHTTHNECTVQQSAFDVPFDFKISAESSSSCSSYPVLPSAAWLITNDEYRIPTND